MDQELINEIKAQVFNYFIKLDWPYILTFILISYALNHHWMAKKIKGATHLRTRRRYRTAIAGIIYGAGLYYVRGYTVQNIEPLIQSFIFAFVFHKFIIETIITYVQRLMPSKSARK